MGLILNSIQRHLYDQFGTPKNVYSIQEPAPQKNCTLHQYFLGLQSVVYFSKSDQENKGVDFRMHHLYRDIATIFFTRVFLRFILAPSFTISQMVQR